jgi:glucose-6-phosphate dehydrogenase assembly protein OpcA
LNGGKIDSRKLHAVTASGDSTRVLTVSHVSAVTAALVASHAPANQARVEVLSCIMGISSRPDRDEAADRDSLVFPDRI